MESASMTLTKIHLLRVDPGEDVLLSVRKFLDEADVRQAVVLGGYGTLAAHHLHWVTHNRLPAKSTYGRAEGGIEILSMNGTIVQGKPHIHVTLSTIGGAYGGHLEEGCIAYVLCEIFIAEVAGPELSTRSVRVSVPEMGEGDVPRLTFGGEM
jgi:predicted DNA-binding protein with PD1-like motif